MGVISSKSFDQPDEIVSGSRVAKRIVTVGKTFVARTEYQPGWHWSKDMKPTARTSSCQHHHQGWMLSGSMHVTSEEGGERVIASDGE